MYINFHPSLPDLLYLISLPDLPYFIPHFQIFHISSLTSRSSLLHPSLPDLPHFIPHFHHFQIFHISSLTSRSSLLYPHLLHFIQRMCNIATITTHTLKGREGLSECKHYERWILNTRSLGVDSLFTESDVEQQYTPLPDFHLK